MNIRRQLARLGMSILVAMPALGLVQGSRAQDEQDELGATEGNSAVQTRVTWHVANNGVDSPVCGKRNSPCRSISQAIVNSTAGDLILVGPGRYGDLNRNDFPFDEGEEPGGLVHITKRLTIISIAGAELTVIEGRVEIAADRTEFGNPGKGFTLADNPTDAGLNIGGPIADVTVSGNIARGNRWGFRTQGGLNHSFVGNVARENEIGFEITSGGARVTDNIAVSNVQREVGGLQGVGFCMCGSVDQFAARNSAVGNESGFWVSGRNPLLRRNSAIGNRHYGIRILPARGPITIERTNIFANNDVSRDQNVNCGILNESDLKVSATNNFWGAPTGPGPDPADEACDVGGGELVVTPFATKAFPIQPAHQGL